MQLTLPLTAARPGAWPAAKPGASCVHGRVRLCSHPVSVVFARRHTRWAELRPGDRRPDNVCALFLYQTRSSRWSEPRLHTPVRLCNKPRERVRGWQTAASGPDGANPAAPTCPPCRRATCNPSVPKPSTPRGKLGATLGPRKRSGGRLIHCSQVSVRQHTCRPQRLSARSSPAARTSRVCAHRQSRHQSVKPLGLMGCLWRDCCSCCTASPSDKARHPYGGTVESYRIGSDRLYIQGRPNWSTYFENTDQPRRISGYYPLCEHVRHIRRRNMSLDTLPDAALAAVADALPCQVQRRGLRACCRRTRAAVNARTQKVRVQPGYTPESCKLAPRLPRASQAASTFP